MPNTRPPVPESLFSRKVHSSLVQTLLNAPGRNARTTGPFFTSSLRRTVSRSWLTREKSGALAPTSIDIHVSFNDRSERSASHILARRPEGAEPVTSSAVTAASPAPWYRGISRDQWHALAAAKVGWMLDAMDFMLYAMAVGQLRSYFGFTDRVAGLLGTVTLIMSGFGGLAFGYIGDRFGRTRALMATITIFSVASLGAATSQNVLQLIAWRAVLGIGMGGEWASGAVLVSETWPTAHRNKAISIMQSGWAIGYILAALMAAAILGTPALGRDAWRWLFATGVIPALFAIWIRRNVQEPVLDATLTTSAEHEHHRTGLVRAASPQRLANPFAVIFGRSLIARTLRIILLTSAVQ